MYNMTNKRSQFESFFDVINKELFFSMIATPHITFSSNARNARFNYRKKDSVLVVHNNWKDGDIANIACDLAHEMTHIYCCVNLKNNIGKTNRCYHDRDFRWYGRMFGLDISNAYSHGGGFEVVSLNEYAKNVVDAHPELQDILSGCDLPDESFECDAEPVYAKYICPKCKCSVRVTSETNVVCAKCNERMLLDTVMDKIVNEKQEGNVNIDDLPEQMSVVSFLNLIGSGAVISI